MRPYYSLFLAFLIVSCASKFDPEITVPDIKENIEVLASDSLGGRRTGEEGGRLAAEYIRKKFENARLELLYNNGFQEFSLVTSAELGNGNNFEAGTTVFEVKKDYLPYSFSANKEIENQVVFAGFGIDAEKDTIKWNDFENLDVSGKWILALQGDPEFDKDESAFIEFSNERVKALTATDKGAAGLLLVAGPGYSAKDELSSLFFDKNSSRYSIPVIQIRRDVANVILSGTGFTIEELEKKMLEEKKVPDVTIDSAVKASVDVLLKETVTQNVVAMIPGNDEQLKDEYVVVGAHYDHLGTGGPGSGSRALDTVAVHNGADDNASGVSVVIQLAEKIKADKSNRRTVIFAAFGAEEMGLVGSKAFTAEPPVKIEKISGMFNFDMVGRLDSVKKGISIGGTKTGLETENILNRLNKGFELSFSPEGVGPSDHASFYLQDIPVFFISTGAHSDYHTPADDADKINFEGVKKISEYALEVLYEVANLDSGLTFQEAGPKFQRQRGGRFKVTFGIMPDYAGLEKRGMRIDAVTKGKPADKGGMLKGDIITAIEGKKVGNIYDYMNRLQTLEKGQTVSVDVIRDQEEIVLIIQL